MYYFAYGSNMSQKRLARRIPAERLGVAILSGYRLAFTKPSESDGSAKCDICQAEKPEDAVYGVLYEVQNEQKAVLDVYEGLGHGYTSEKVTVVWSGREVEAVTYIAVHRNDSIFPFNWYKEHVIRGSLENGMPGHYVESIRKIPSKKDPDNRRAASELSIYK